MNTFVRSISILCLTGATGMALAACESEFGGGPLGPRRTRAIASPVEENSASGEMARDATAGVPILSVEFPNTKKEPPTVQVLGRPVSPPPASQPATAPANTGTHVLPPAATQSAPPSRVDPIYGPP